LERQGSEGLPHARLECPQATVVDREEANQGIFDMAKLQFHAAQYEAVM
jgi:hypothetical protein